MVGRASGIRVGKLKESEAKEADRIMRLAFGTFIGLPDPTAFLGDRDMLGSRIKSEHVKALAARDGERLIGSNLLTQWGSVGFFGPLTVLPEYWDKGVAQKLLELTMKEFDAWGVRRTGLFTFPHSTKHVGLYQKFGYWPQYLTLLMNYQPDAASATNGDGMVKMSTLATKQRNRAIKECAALTRELEKGLDLSGEIRAAVTRGTGEVLLTHTKGKLDGFALCMHGPGSEGGEKLCYVKFAAARSGKNAGARFERLLDACDAFAAARGVPLEAGVNTACEDAVRRMQKHGYRAKAQGVAMTRPHDGGYHRPDAYVLNDWR